MRDLCGCDVQQPPAVRVPGIVEVIRVDLVRTADDLCHPAGRIIGNGLCVDIRPAHAGGQHAIIVFSGHKLAVRIFHRNRHVSKVIQCPFSNKGSPRNDFGFLDQPSTFIILPGCGSTSECSPSHLGRGWGLGKRLGVRSQG
jgi:hypothetical protein